MDFQNELNERFKLQQEYLGNHKAVNLIEPIVSVCVATYQHVNFIKECLEGILMQQTSFPYEIILGEDESTDGTREICIEYAEKYPDKIRLFLRDRKLTHFHINGNDMIMNGRLNRMSACGKYIALCEGDDFWTDPLKLQKQVDFLEANPDYSLCFHNFYYLTNDNLKLATLFNGDSINFEEYARDLNGIQTLTVVFRNTLIPIEDPKVNAKIRGSKFLFLQLAEHGKMKYINEPMAVYRVHSGGVWSGITKFNQSKMALENIEAMILYFNTNKMINKILKETYCKTSRKFFVSLIKNNKLRDAIKIGFISLKNGINLYNINFIFHYLIYLLKNKNHES